MRVVRGLPDRHILEVRAATVVEVVVPVDLHMLAAEAAEEALYIPVEPVTEDSEDKADSSSTTSQGEVVALHP